MTINIDTIIQDELQKDVFGTIEDNRCLSGLESFNMHKTYKKNHCELSSTNLNYRKRLLLPNDAEAVIDVNTVISYPEGSCGNDTTAKQVGGTCVTAKSTGNTHATWLTTITVSLICPEADGLDQDISTKTRTFGSFWNNDQSYDIAPRETGMKTLCHNGKVSGSLIDS